jgi:hypothetical protein
MSEKIPAKKFHEYYRPTDFGINAENARKAEEVKQGRSSVYEQQDQIAEKPKESRQYWHSKLSGLISELTSESKEKTAERSRKEARENRLEGIAEKFAAQVGISADRSALIAARKELFEAEKKFKKNGYAPDNIGDLRKAHSELSIAYTKKLTEAARELDEKNALAGLEKHSMLGRATLIRLHDTVRAPQDMLSKAREEARKESGMANFDVPARIFGKAFKAYGNFHKWGATKLVEANEKLNKKEYTPEERNRLIEKYARGSQIVTAAGISTLAFGGFAPLGLGLSAGFLFRASRTALGGYLGGKAAQGVGNWHDKNRGKERKATYEETRKEAPATAEELEKQIAAYAKGNRKAIEKDKRTFQFGAAILAGGSLSLSTNEAMSLIHSPGISTMANLPSVQNSVDTIEHAKGGSVLIVLPVSQGIENSFHNLLNHFSHKSAHPVIEKIAHHVPTKQELLQHAILTRENALPEVRVIPGQGADALFRNFQKLLDDHQPHSALVDKILQSNPHELAKSLGFPKGNLEGYMHPGDSVKIENHTLIFKHGGKSYVLMNETVKNGKVTASVAPGVSDMHKQLFPKVGHEAVHHTLHNPHHLPEKNVPKDSSTASSELPTGMNPDGPEAAGYLTKLKNPTVFDHPVHSPESTNVHPAPSQEVAHSPEPHETRKPSAPIEIASPVHTDIFLNKLGYKINPHEPIVYKSGSNYEIWGGAYEAQVEKVQNFLQEPRNYGKTAYLEHVIKNQFTGAQERVVYSFSSDSEGTLQVGMLDEPDASIPPFNPDTFAPAE